MRQALAGDIVSGGSEVWKGMRRNLRGILEPLSWMILCAALGNGVRALWIHEAAPVPVWGGLFFDMMGIAVAGLARGPVVACGVAVLNQVFRMSAGQFSSAFVPVEITGAVFWGWLASRGLVVTDWRRPLHLLRTYALAVLGGGVTCAFMAWMVNLVLRGQWGFMPIRQRLYEHLDFWNAIKAIPTEMAISVWDKSVSVAAAMVILVGLHGLGKRYHALSPTWARTLRLYTETLTAGMCVLIFWGVFHCVRVVGRVSSAPLAIDFLLLRQTLLVSSAYLIVCTIFILTLILRHRTSLNRLTFVLGWAAVSIGAMVVFLSGVFLAANALTWSTYRASWDGQHQLMETMRRDGPRELHPGTSMFYLRDLTAAERQHLEFFPSWSASQRVTWADLELGSDEIFPPKDSRDDELEGYLRGSGGLQIALFAKDGPGHAGPAIIYQEAPWLFSHGYRDRLVPTLSVMVILFLLMGFLTLLLGRQMLDTASEAVLGRQARVLADRIRARNRELESLQSTLEAAVAQRESRIRELASLAEVGKAVGVLAHEIRNPIGTIQMAFGNLLDSLGTDRQGDLNDQILIIERQIRHMGMLTQSVLAFSRGAPRDHDTERCSAAAVCHSCQALFSPTAQRFDATLTTEEPSPNFFLAARENEVIQILQNLILNALESIASCAPPLTRRAVSLHVRREGDHAFFEVSDSGPGVPPANRERIFDIFYSSKAQGTGLGLFVARELARMLRGDLAIAEGEDHECRFVLRIPAVD